MDTRDFLRRVLGYEGHYCIFGAKDGSRVQKFYPDLDQAAQVAEQLDSNGYDTYFGLATFGVNDEGKHDRKAERAIQLRSFFMDLDCGAGKPFETQAEALASLKQFVKWNNLPVPTVVNSGGGIHVYWPLHEPVPVDKWRPAAESLKALCREQEFGADPAITADAARILRVPGTHNYKLDTPRDVAIIGEIRAPVSFDDFVVKLPEPKLALVPAREGLFDDALMKRLLGGRVSNFKRILDRTMAGEGCAQLAHAMTHQGDIDEPMWRAALSVAWHCEDGEKAIHVISKRHPEYSAEVTRQKAEGTKGPYRCEKFDEFRAGVCRDCKHWGKIGSPITLGAKIVEGEPLQIANGVKYEDEESDEDSHVNGHTVTTFSEIKLPLPYKRRLEGGIYREEYGEKDEDGKVQVKEIPVYHNDLYVTHRVDDPDTGENLVWKVHLPKDGVREFMAPLRDCTSREKFREVLATHGVPAIGKRLDALMDYARAWTESLQEIASADVANLQFGWNDYNKMESFVLGKNRIMADKTIHAPVTVKTAGYANSMEPQGDLAEWKRIMDFYNRPGMELHQFMIGCCAGAPLMALTPIHGGILHIMSDGSGLGKTTTSLAGLSIWGDPSKLLSHRQDTVNSRMLRAEVFCNLPVVMDEITNIEPKDASDLAYQVSNGMQRDRLESGANKSRWRGRPWHTIMITTGNSSLMDKLSSIKISAEGEARRIMEYEATRVMFKSKAETDNFANRVKANYGFAGAPLVRSYLKNIEKTKEGFERIRDEIDTRCGLRAEDRFYSAIVTSALLGLTHMKSLKLIDYDLTALRDWTATDFVPTCLGNVSALELTLDRIMADYINAENYGSLLRIKSSDDLRSGSDNLDNLVIPDKQPGFRFVARYETDTKMLFIMPGPFKDWCHKKQISYHSVSKKLKDEYGATMRKIRMNKGTRFDMPATQVWAIDLSKVNTEFAVKE